jgi:uncharacterized membrane protein
MQGSFYSLNLDWPNKIKNFFTVTHINTFRYVSATYKCSSSGESINAYFAGMISAFIAPYCFILIILAAVGVFWLRLKYVQKSSRDKQRDDEFNDDTGYTNPYE